MKSNDKSQFIAKIKESALNKLRDESKNSSLGVRGVTLCGVISTLKIGAKISDQLLLTIRQASLRDDCDVIRLGDIFVIRGYCLGTIQQTETHVVIAKNEKGDWVRSTRAEKVYKEAYKATRAMLDDPIIREL